MVMVNLMLDTFINSVIFLEICHQETPNMGAYYLGFHSHHVLVHHLVVIYALLLANNTEYTAHCKPPFGSRMSG